MLLLLAKVHLYFKEPPPHKCIIILFVTMLNTGLCLIRIKILILIYLPDCFVISNVHIRKPTTSEWIVTFRSIREDAGCSHTLCSTKKSLSPHMFFTNSLWPKCLSYYKVTIPCLLSSSMSVTSSELFSPSMTTHCAQRSQMTRLLYSYFILIYSL